MTITGHSFASAACRAGAWLFLLLASPLAIAQGEADPKPAAGSEPPVPQDTVETLGVLRPGSGRPDPFTLFADTGVEPLTVVQTRPIELTGFDGPLLLTIEGGIDVIIVQNDRAFRRRRTLVMPGDVIVLSARSPLDYGAAEEIVLTVGDYSTPWVIMNRVQDRMPIAVAFPEAVSPAPGRRVVSQTRPLFGFEGTVEARLTGPGEPLLRINGGDWLPAAPVVPGDHVQLSATAPAAGEQLQLMLTVGDLSAPWEVTTPPPMEAEVPPGG